MKKRKKYMTTIMVIILLLIINTFPTFAFENSNDEGNNSITISEEIISEEEYIHIVAQNYKISYDEAQNYINETRKEARVEPESVVNIKRSVTNKVNKDFVLRCTVYMEVVRDNMNGGKYIEILSILSPLASLEGPHVNVQMGDSTSTGKVISPKEAKVYTNGNIQYTIPYSVSGSFSFPGVSIGGTVGYDVIYSYDVSTTFTFTI